MVCCSCYRVIFALSHRTFQKGNRGAYPAMLRLSIVLLACILGRLTSPCWHFFGNCSSSVHSFGVLGYLRYGADVDQIITQELSQSAIVVKCVRWGLVVGICCTFPLQVATLVSFIMCAYLSFDVVFPGGASVRVDRTRRSRSLILSSLIFGTQIVSSRPCCKRILARSGGVCCFLA